MIGLKPRRLGDLHDLKFSFHHSRILIFKIGQKCQQYFYASTINSKWREALYGPVDNSNLHPNKLTIKTQY